MNMPSLSHKERLQRAKWSLEGLSIGDAYGNHHGHNQSKRASPIWEFSDDTIMALSIVENLSVYGEINQDALAHSFAERWDGQRGYGQGVTRLLKSIRRGEDWRKASNSMFDGTGSAGNGAAMRVAPLGAYFADDLDQVVEQARRSAVVTHAHPEGVAGAIAVAVAAALAFQYRAAERESDWKAWLENITKYLPETEVGRKISSAIDLDTSPQQAAAVLGNGRPVLAQLTVPFALWAAGHFLSDFEKAIRQTASVRGDVDTNCAIVGGIVVMYAGIEGIPSSWIQRREHLPEWTFNSGDASQ
jgi:ADP-ribosylglycohydrolase